MTDTRIQPVSTIISAKWICPVRPHNTVLEDHSIIIDEDRIIDIIETKKVASLYQSNQHFQLHHHIVTPGLINAHTHAAMNLFRGFADDQPLRAIKQSGMRANIGLFVMDYPSNYANDGEDYLMKGLEARDGWRDESRITSSLAPHAPYSVSDKTLNQVLTYANQLNLTIHMHIHETENEISESLKQYQIRPIERLNRLGIISPQFMAVHAVYLNDEDLSTLSKESASVIHCPTSNLKLGSGIANIEALQKNHINVCIGTDGSASNNKQDVLHDMQLASLLAKGMTKNPAILDAKISLDMVTINAAKALGLEDCIGSIEKGKFADLTVFNMDHLSTLPMFDPMSHLVYATTREEVSHVWVNGLLQYEEGHLTSIDIQSCKDIALRWQLKLKQNI